MTNKLTAREVDADPDGGPGAMCLFRGEREVAMVRDAATAVRFVADDAALDVILALCRGETPDPLPEHPAVAAVVELRKALIHADSLCIKLQIREGARTAERDAALARVAETRRLMLEDRRIDGERVTELETALAAERAAAHEATVARVVAVLAANGCDCDCGNEVYDDGELCLACRVEAALRAPAARAALEDK